MYMLYSVSTERAQRICNKHVRLYVNLREMDTILRNSWKHS